ncbi:MAG: insulinase family protein [Blastocatellia bacterium]|nr:insulinase family protein [Blastocatellia bacterium]
MPRSLVSFLLAGAVLASLLVSAPAAALAQAKSSRLEYRERTLANGMRVLSAVDRSSPTVCINVWYHVGSKDDPDGRSGFAHLFEHMLFKGTRNMKDEQMDRLTEDVGGFNNAFTADDVTVYYEVVPSNYLETLLWAEAERMSSLNVVDKNFLSERDVVKEEYRQNYLARPYGRLFLEIEKKSFTKHPYKRPGIGNIDELNAATIDDVKKFHSDYYRPDNATLVVVGDFDPKQLDAWVDRFFADVPKPSTPLPRVTIQEPARTAEQRHTVTAPNVPLPAVAMTFLLPKQTDEDVYALQVAESILANGESSRLYNSLVYTKQVASEAGAQLDLREDVSLFVVYTILAGGKSPADGEAALAAEIARMQDASVTAAELEKAKNQLVTAKLFELETNDGKAEALGRAAVLYGDPNRINTEVARLQTVTAADVQRVMKKYFGATNRVVLTYLPEPAAAAEGAPAK